ncbi:MAG: SGNH/GDSL hydrolase family protein [Clostridia bacterium]|nr:SGNH/GDSL hydrolase family protein [Clostridia bacterium]
MNFKKTKFFLAVFTTIIMVFSSTVFGVTKQGIVYTALGDSIAYGTGATDLVGYTDLFNEHLNKKLGNEKYFNMSYDGATSEDLLISLNDPFDYFGAQTAIVASEVITISIGGNDLLGPFLEALGGVVYNFYLNPDYTVDFESLLADLSEWENDLTTHYQFNEMLTGLSSELPGLVYNFTSNWVIIINRIRELNPNADIYVNTVFNPLKFSPRLYQFADPAIQGLNVPIHYFAGIFDYKVVDVYSIFEAYGNPNRLVVGDLSTLAFMVDPDYSGPIPLHPTDMGYKLIFNMHKDLMD